MKNEQKIANNIKILRTEQGLSQEKLADELGISSSRLANYEQGTRSIPIDVLAGVSARFHLALDVIVKSDLSKIDLKSLSKVGDNRLLFPIIINENTGYESIEIVPVKASAGYLTGYADPDFVEELPKMTLPFIGNGTHRAFQIKGDSMLPVRDGSYIVGRFVEDLKAIKNGKTYVALTKDNGVVYKRLYNKTNEDGGVYFHSDNRAYNPYLVEPSDILEVWEFRCCVFTNEYEEQELGMENLVPVLNGIYKELNEIKGKMLNN